MCAKNVLGDVSLMFYMKFLIEPPKNRWAGWQAANKMSPMKCERSRRRLRSMFQSRYVSVALWAAKLMGVPR